MIPWQPGCPHREAALGWLLDRIPAQVGRHDGVWVKARAVQAAVQATTAPIVVVHDADVWCDGLPEAIQAVREGAPWAVPHRMVRRLSQTATGDVLAGGPLGGELAEREYPGHPGGGIVVLPRQTWDACPIDPRFEGWGQEDDAWYLALCGLVGSPWTGRAVLWHLWHPPQPRRTRAIGSADSAALFQRYRRARRDPSLLASLIEEAKDELSAPDVN